MATQLERVGRNTLDQLDYVGSLNIQLWVTLRAMAKALPFVGNRYRWEAAVIQMRTAHGSPHGSFHRLHSRDAGSVRVAAVWRSSLRH
jgi:hypothetical protein